MDAYFGTTPQETLANLNTAIATLQDDIAKLQREAESNPVIEVVLAIAIHQLNDFYQMRDAYQRMC